MLITAGERDPICPAPLTRALGAYFADQGAAPLGVELRTRTALDPASALDDLEEAVEDAVTYVREHIVSFAIGAAVVAVILIGSAIYTSNKKKDTNGQDLDLGSNRFYRKD